MTLKKEELPQCLDLINKFVPRGALLKAVKSAIKTRKSSNLPKSFQKGCRILTAQPKVEESSSELPKQLSRRKRKKNLRTASAFQPSAPPDVYADQSFKNESDTQVKTETVALPETVVVTEESTPGSIEVIITQIKSESAADTSASNTGMDNQEESITVEEPKQEPSVEIQAAAEESTKDTPTDLQRPDQEMEMHITEHNVPAKRKEERLASGGGVEEEAVPAKKERLDIDQNTASRDGCWEFIESVKIQVDTELPDTIILEERNRESVDDSSFNCWEMSVL